MSDNVGKLVVVTGFSGAGKDTLINMLLQKRSDFDLVVTHSTRPQRPGEIPGVHHHFVNYREFQTLIQKGEMLEYVKYGSFYKGTSKEAFKKIFDGKNLIWRVDLLRAATYEETFTQVFDEKTSQTLCKKSVNLLIKTPSYRSALSRYIKRDRENPDIKEFEKRLQRDVSLYNKYKDRFQHVIVNKTGKINDSLTEMENIIDSIL